MSINAGTEAAQRLQASQYEFPYHWLPQQVGGTWIIGRDLRWGFEYLATLEAVASLVVARSARSVLDFGCGDGRLLATLLDSGVEHVTGVDLDTAAISFARGFTRPWADRTTIICDDVAAVEGTFDCVVAMEVLEHIPDAEIPRVVEALRRRCDEAGAFVVSVPTTNVAVQAKHERHYDLDLLAEHLAPHFAIESTRWLHRPGPLERRLRSVVVNRWFALRDQRLLRLAASAYRRSVLEAGAADGAHLLSVARPI